MSTQASIGTLFSYGTNFYKNIDPCDQGNLQPCGGSSLEETQIQISEDGDYCQLLLR